ncbi:putative lipid II flippase FtsW [candidate division KSB1 bacterium]
MAEKKPTTDLLLLAAILTLVAVGIVMVFSASTFKAEKDYGDTYHILKKHLIRVAIGLVLMVILSRINYNYFRKFAKTGLFLAAGLIMYMFFSNAVAVKGSVRWLELGGFSFQPSEFAKIAIVFYMADAIIRKQDKFDSLVEGFLPLLLILGSMCLLILIEPDFSSAVIIGFIVFIMFYLGKVRIRHLAGTIITIIPIMALAVSSSPYRMRRFTGFLDPSADTLGINYQINQSLISLGSGGFTGVGIGQSKEKLLYLPEPFTDFIFSILGEELGFLGAIFVMIMFFIILWRGLNISAKISDPYGSILAAGITLNIVVTAMINIGVVCGLLPTTGLPLPFISYGGSSLLFTLASCGVLLNIGRSYGGVSKEVIT